MDAAKIKLMLQDFQRNEPVSGSGLNKLLEFIQSDPPNGYVDFLKVTNGGFGEIGASYIHLYSAEEVIEFTGMIGAIRENFPSFFVIGSDGAGIEYFLDASTNPASIVEMDQYNTNRDECIQHGSDFIIFLDKDK